MDEPLAGKQDRTWAMLCHVASFAGFVVPFGNIVGPLVVWLIRKEAHPLVDDQGKESLNFQITMTIAVAVSVLLAFLLIGLPILLGLIVYDVVAVVLASIKANEGVAYRYPLTLRLVK